MAVMAGRSTRSLERMREASRKFSINDHFRREGVIPAVLFGAIIIVAALVALLGPWFLQFFG